MKKLLTFILRSLATVLYVQHRAIMHLSRGIDKFLCEHSYTKLVVLSHLDLKKVQETYAEWAKDIVQSPAQDDLKQQQLLEIQKLLQDVVHNIEGQGDALVDGFSKSSQQVSKLFKDHLVTPKKLQRPRPPKAKKNK